MTETIRREVVIPQPREVVWRAIADREALATWMFPNDFEPKVGHRFTFHVPAKLEVKFDGLVVRCEVLECTPPSRLVFSWAAGELTGTTVTFRLEPEGAGTRVQLEHAGFDVTQPWGKQAVKGAEYGWANMLKKLTEVAAGLAAR
jgi:uncharacterized protein YndB with AHSA1/START domain